MEKTKKWKKILDRKLIITAVICLILLFLISRLTFNPTDSAEKGFFYKKLFPKYTKGNYVLYKLKPEYKQYVDVTFYRTLKNRKEENTEIILLKKIAAVPGDTIEIDGYQLFINGKKTADILRLKGLTENSVKKRYVIKEGEVFLLGENPENSFDSRYFGEVAINDLSGEVVMILSYDSLQEFLKKYKFIK